MKLITPIIDRPSYHKVLSKEIYQFLYDNIFRTLFDILNAKPVIKQVKNSIAGGSANLMFQGIPIHIENWAGTERKGKKWIQKMAHDYGYICGTRAIDGDELDCFVGNHLNTEKFFVVEQINPKTEKFDEYKIMFGFKTLLEAKEGYFKNYQKGWQGFSHIQELPMATFWQWYEDHTPVFAELKNAPATPLIQALTQGLITYEENKYFKGKLNAAISKQLRAIGAKYNSTVKAYQIEPAKIPPDIQAAIAAGSARAREKVQKVQAYLKSIEGRDLPEMKIERSFGKALTDLDKQFENTTRKVVPSNLEVSMAPGHQEALKTAYAENLEKYIKEWYDEAILRLRSKVMDNTLSGYRAEALISTIQQENRVSWNKAKFLAKQENSILVAKYREIRYTENGINYYMWSTSHDSRVRHRHRELEGKIFRFDNPPIVDIHKMRRGNPGDDFGPCRCVAIPILSDRQEIEFKEKARA